MAGHDSHPVGGNTVLLFGPQALSFREASFCRVRLSVSKSPTCQWILDAIEDLPNQWNILRKEFSKLSVVPGAELLQELRSWFRNGAMKQKADNLLPNILLSPLVVLIQLTQYAEHLEFAKADYRPNHQDVFARRQPGTETLGFCTGILSAVVVSCCTNQYDFEKLGATAVRLAMLVGALVDAQEVHDKHGESRSLATVWKSHESSLQMSNILERFPEVRIRNFRAIKLRITI